MLTARYGDAPHAAMSLVEGAWQASNPMPVNVAGTLAARTVGAGAAEALDESAVNDFAEFELNDFCCALASLNVTLSATCCATSCSAPAVTTTRRGDFAWLTTRSGCTAVPPVISRPAPRFARGERASLTTPSVRCTDSVWPVTVAGQLLMAGLPR